MRQGMGISCGADMHRAILVLSQPFMPDWPLNPIAGFLTLAKYAAFDSRPLLTGLYTSSGLPQFLSLRSSDHSPKISH